MAGAIRLGELTHVMESRIEAAIEAGQFPPALFEELEAKMDRLSLDLERMRRRASAAPAAAGGARRRPPHAPRRRALEPPPPAPPRCCASTPTPSIA